MKKMMLIAPSLHQGGIENVCVRTARMLAPYFDITIVIFDPRNQAYDTEGIRVVNLDLPSIPNRLAKAFRVFERGIQIRKLIQKEKFDIVYSFGPTSNLASIASGKTKALKLFSIHSYMDMGNPRQIRMFCKYSDVLFCCSKAICEEIRNDYHCEKAVVLNNPFDIEEIQKLAEDETDYQVPFNTSCKEPFDSNKKVSTETSRRILISMGREDPIKGFWHLIKSFAKVHEVLPDTALVILGKGEFESYKKLAKELGVDQDIYFAGMQKNPYPYLKNSDLYVLTSYNEGFPNAVIEAMAVGLPVVATDCKTGPREIIGDNNERGILVPNMSPEEDFTTNIDEMELNLAKTIINLLEDEKQLEEYRKVSLERAKDFGQEIYIEKIKKNSISHI